MNKKDTTYTFLYKPSFKLLIFDALSWIMASAIMLLWRVVADKETYWAYVLFLLTLFCVWTTVSYLVRKYYPVKIGNHPVMFYRTVLTIGIVVIFAYFGQKFFIGLSPYVIFWTFALAIIISLLLLLINYLAQYAIYLDDSLPTFVERLPAHVDQPPYRLDSESIASIRASVKDFAGEEALSYLDSQTELGSSNTLLMAVSRRFNILKIKTYKYDCIINLMPINNIRGINKMFCAVNEKLPDDGIFVCCFTPQSVFKKRLLEKYPAVINYIIYIWTFFIKRILPKMQATSRIYLDLNKDGNRYFSQTEILGRLYYCGFRVVDEHSIGELSYIVARRTKIPEPQSNRVYGVLIRLTRVGWNGKKFRCYKVRTMHPYSEYLQAYMYEKYSLQEGGKINNDIRVSTLGAFLRKHWLDELPMLFNLLRGDIKLVGVRPLSSHYFSLYSSELQAKRIKFRPGLLPPYYADMPKTLDEIQASEMRYLDACEEKGVFRTDLRYFFKIMFNILFKHVRSK
jgi:lipopolysaccharide/colanic/teichoic acid biosynthesis glycosyltransferase